jgi:PAS domain-containing protein
LNHRPQDARESKPELAPLGSWEFRFDTGLFEFNDGFYAIYGTTVAREGRFMTPEAYVREFVHPDDRQYVGEVCASSTRGQRPHIVEHRIVRRDGAVRIIRVWAIVNRGSCARDSQKICGVNQDITEYKLMEQELRASREQLSAAAKLARLAPWEFDHQKGLFDFRDEFYAVYGTTMAREGRFMTPETYVREFVHPDDAAMVREVIADDTIQWPSIFQHRIIRRDGAVRTIRVWRGAINRDAAGNIEKVFGGNQDITDEILAKNALRESEERHKATLSALPDMLLRLDADGKLLDCRIPEQHAAYLHPAAYATVEDLLPAPPFRIPSKNWPPPVYCSAKPKPPTTPGNWAARPAPSKSAPRSSATTRSSSSSATRRNFTAPSGKSSASTASTSSANWPPASATK